jgi:hypothetical protein
MTHEWGALEQTRIEASGPNRSRGQISRKIGKEGSVRPGLNPAAFPNDWAGMGCLRGPHAPRGRVLRG